MATPANSGGPSTDKPAGSHHAAVSRRLLAAVLLIVALSGCVRLVDLDRFSATVFDEHYYVHDALLILHGDLGASPTDEWKPAKLLSVAHPDLGKLAIAAGIALFGNDAWGWRVPSALAGTALIGLVFPLARRMGLTAEWSLAALILAASDPMLMLESRLGVLDTFVALFTALAVFCALGYVQAERRGVWLLACGVALGAAVASKWSGVLAVLAVAAVVVPALVGRRQLRASLGALVAALVLVPVAVYALSATHYFAAGYDFADWFRLQAHMAGFGWGVQGDRSFASAPITWPFDAVPIWYVWSLTQNGTVGLLAIGNPLLWWSASVAWVVLGVVALLRRDARLGLAPLIVATLYLPWLLTSRQTYIYYMLPVVPFLAILLASALAHFCGAQWISWHGGPDAILPERSELRPPWRRAAAWVFCLGCAAVGALFVPFVLGLPVPFEYYDRLMVFTTWR